MEKTLIFKNVMEDTVFDMLDNLVISNQLDCCHCETCKLDVAAIVLNSIPAKYVVSLTGDMYSRFNSNAAQSGMDISIALIKAAEIVKNNPRHQIKKDN